MRLEISDDALHDQPIRLFDLYPLLGVSDRTLRLYCAQAFGLSPHRYLHLRRMQHVRRVLQSADPATATVTDIALDHGFAELGRFAGQYRVLFGKVPSATLHRPPTA